MKKFITLFLLVISSLFLVSCHKTSSLNTEVVVIFYTDGGSKIDRIKKGTTEEIDLYSRLAFKVSFDTLYLDVDRVILVDPNEVIPATGTNNNILNPKRSGYNFIGWYNIDTRPYVEKQELPPAEALVDFSNKIIDQEFKVYAYWEKI